MIIEFSRLYLTGLTLAFLSATSIAKTVDVTVTNPSSKDRMNEIVELNASELVNKVGSAHLYVTDSEMKEIPSQITYDSLLIFSASVPAGGETKYQIHSSEAPHIYLPIVTGKTRPERQDDLSWENDLVGFRAYGPDTRHRGEKAFGYDIFFKHPTQTPVLDILYEMQTSSANWAKVDSLRKVDPRKAKAFQDLISYHIDSGLGMDCYAVGPTLGDGTTALLVADSIYYPWTYENIEILDNGPLRFTARLIFPKASVGKDKSTIETRTITLDAGSHLNRCTVTYEGLSKPQEIVTGFPLRDDSKPISDLKHGIIAYADPTQGPDNGKALLGVILPDGIKDSFRKDNHILGIANTSTAKPFTYYWGFAWDKADITSLKEWHEYLIDLATRQPLSCRISTSL